jgi:glutathione S-transferase
MLELYGIGGSRWVKCYWMLKELGLEFKEHPVNLQKGEQFQPEILALNPFGKLPAFKDADVVLFESTAIINYLGDKHPESEILPRAGTLQRALCDQWVSFCTTELEQPLWRITKHKRLLPEAKRSPADIELATSDFHTLAKIFEQKLGSKKYIVGDRFSTADITVAYTLSWARALQLLGPYENCQRYLTEMTARPALPQHLYK